MVDIKLPRFNLSRISLPFIKRQRLSLGLDIGSHSVKMCELQEIPAGYQLLSLGNATVPPGAVEDGVLQDPEAVARVISTLAKNLKISGKKVAISVSGYSVIVKKISLGVLPDEQLEKHIYSEAEQYIPFDIDDVYLDFQDLKTNASGDDRTDVMLVAAKREVIDSYLSMVDAAGLKAIVVDVDAFALGNAYDATFHDADNIGLIDIGASKTIINIVSGGNSILTRDIVLGSRQLTEEIQNRIGVSYEEAEALKTGSAAAGGHTAQLQEIFANSCGQWVTEIKRAIDFYYANYPEKTLAKLVLSGGGAKVRGFAEYLCAESGALVEVFNPFANMVCDNRAIDPEYLAAIAPEMTIATGLATRPVAF